jgi:predicted ABC-type ATPase
MMTLGDSVNRVLKAQTLSAKPFGIILAGHNGSGKSTMWRKHLSLKLRIPLVNADRMILAVLPELSRKGRLVPWAANLRDTDQSWMRVAQKGVEAFVAQAMANKVPFAMETVFSRWREKTDGVVESKIQLISQMQKEGYFVLLCFVGLANASLSIARVRTRTASGGHDVPLQKLFERFPRTQRAIRSAASVADATILLDNSLDQPSAFSVCRIQLRDEEVFDLRRNDPPPAAAIREWLDVVSPIAEHDLPDPVQVA